jgi:hypothetical protein
MSGATGRSTVSIGVDGSADGDDAVRWAARDASMRSLPARPIVGELGGQKPAEVHTEMAYAGVVSALIDA